MPTNESKALQILRGNIEWLKLDMQINDVLCRKAIRDMKLYKRQNAYLSTALKVRASKYDTLVHPVSQASVIFNQSINRRQEYAICQTYGFFTAYLHSILFEMYKHNPLKVVDSLLKNVEKDEKVKSLSTIEIIKLGSYPKIERKIIDDIFRKLEDEQSTKSLLMKILKCCDMEDRINGNDIKETLKYLELRHIIIHHNGIIDSTYANTYGDSYNPHVKAGYKMQRTYEICRQTYEKTLSLCKAIDSALIKNNCISARA